MVRPGAAGRPALYAWRSTSAVVAVAAVLYFLVVLPLNKLAERRARGIAEPESDLRPCPECLSEIPKAATRCAACTAVVPATA